VVRKSQLLIWPEQGFRDLEWQRESCQVKKGPRIRCEQRELEMYSIQIEHLEQDEISCCLFYGETSWVSHSAEESRKAGMEI